MEGQKASLKPQNLNELLICPGETIGLIARYMKLPDDERIST
jgi:hypothetical protein